MNKYYWVKILIIITHWKYPPKICKELYVTEEYQYPLHSKIKNIKRLAFMNYVSNGKESGKYLNSVKPYLVTQ